MEPAFHVSARKVGGIWFVKAGRLNLSFSVSRRAPEPAPLPLRGRIPPAFLPVDVQMVAPLLPRRRPVPGSSVRLVQI